MLLLEVLKNDPINGKEVDQASFIGAAAGEAEDRLTVVAVRIEGVDMREVVRRLGNEKRMEGRIGLFGIKVNLGEGGNNMRRVYS